MTTWHHDIITSSHHHSLKEGSRNMTAWCHVSMEEVRQRSHLLNTNQILLSDMTGVSKRESSSDFEFFIETESLWICDLECVTLNVWLWLSGYDSIYLFTRLESLAWSQQGFWQPSFCRKRNLWSLCLDWGSREVLLFIAFLEERECVEMLWMM